MELVFHSNEVLKRKLRTVFNRLHDSKCSPKSGECCFYAWIQKCVKEFRLDMEDEYDKNNNNNNNSDDDDDVDEGDNARSDDKDPSYMDLIILWKRGRLDLNDCHEWLFENHGVVSVKVDDLILVNAYLESFDAGHSVKARDGASDNGSISHGYDEKHDIFYPCSHGGNVGFGWILCTEQFKFFRIVDNYYYHQFHPSDNPSLCKFSGIRKSCTLCCDSPARVSLALFLTAMLFLLCTFPSVRFHLFVCIHMQVCVRACMCHFLSSRGCLQCVHHSFLVRNGKL